MTQTRRFPKEFVFSLIFHIVFFGAFYTIKTLQYSDMKNTRTYEVLLIADPIEKEEPVVVATAPAKNKTSVSQGTKEKSAKKAPQKSVGFDALLAAAQVGKKVKTKGVKSNLDHAQPDLRSDVKKRLMKSNSNALAGLNKFLKVKKKNYKMKWDQVSNLSTQDSITAIDREAIARLIAKHDSQFRECLEKALLRDEKIGGKAKLSLTVAQGGRVNRSDVIFQGKGNAPSQTLLKSCLMGVSQQLKFPSSVAGKTLKFGLLLKS